MDTVARFGGDGFMIMVAILLVAMTFMLWPKVMDVFDEPFVVEGRGFYDGALVWPYSPLMVMMQKP